MTYEEGPKGLSLEERAEGPAWSRCGWDTVWWRGDVLISTYDKCWRVCLGTQRGSFLSGPRAGRDLPLSLPGALAPAQAELQGLS